MIALHEEKRLRKSFNYLLKFEMILVTIDFNCIQKIVLLCKKIAQQFFKVSYVLHARKKTNTSE